MGATRADGGKGGKPQARERELVTYRLSASSCSFSSYFRAGSGDGGSSRQSRRLWQERRAGRGGACNGDLQDARQRPGRSIGCLYVAGKSADFRCHRSRRNTSFIVIPNAMSDERNGARRSLKHVPRRSEISCMGSNLVCRSPVLSSELDLGSRPANQQAILLDHVLRMQWSPL